MNIFAVDKDPFQAAQDLCDKHVVKMILETAQLLCSPFEDGIAPYKRAYYNYPCAKWLRRNISNYEWLLDHGLSLAREYTFRYKKIHAKEYVIHWCIDNYLDFNLLDLPSGELTPWPLVMLDRYKIPEPYTLDGAVSAYRRYYLGEKRRFAKWKNKRNPPWWWR